MEETPAPTPSAPVVPMVVMEEEQSEKAIVKNAKELVDTILPPKEEVTLDEIGKNGNGDHLNGLNGGGGDSFGGSEHAVLHEEHQEDMKQPVIEIEPETHPSEEQEVSEQAQMETSEDTEKPSSPVEQATPDSALSEEDTQEDKLEPPTPPPSTNFETPVPEGTEPEVPHDIQEDVARKLEHLHLEQDNLVQDSADKAEPKAPSAEEDVVESEEVPKVAEPKLEETPVAESVPSPGSEDIVSSEDVPKEAPQPFSPVEEVPVIKEEPLVSEELTNASLASVKSLELESQKGDQLEEEKQVESAAAQPSQESELVESEAVPQVEPQEHAVHPAVEPNLVDEEPEPVKHTLLTPTEPEDVKEPEPKHHPAPHSPSAAQRESSHNIPPAIAPVTKEDTSATAEVESLPKFPVQSGEPAPAESKPERPPPPVTQVHEEPEPTTSNAAEPPAEEGAKDKKTGTLTHRARESFANAKRRLNCTLL